MLLLRLLEPECLDRIDTRGAAGREDRGGQRGRKKNRNRQDNACHVVWGHLVEEGPNETCEQHSSSEADQKPEARDNEHFGKDRPKHGDRSRAQRDADANLARALDDRIAHRSVHADYGQRQSHEREESPQQRNRMLVPRPSSFVRPCANVSDLFGF